MPAIRKQHPTINDIKHGITTKPKLAKFPKDKEKIATSRHPIPHNKYLIDFVLTPPDCRAINFPFVI